MTVYFIISLDKTEANGILRYMSNNRNKEVENLAACFKALSNPHRLRIFIKLITCCSPGTSCPVKDGMSACVGELGKDLGLAASTISHHIKELHTAGLLRMERSGQRIECRVDVDALRKLSGFLAGWGIGISPATLDHATSIELKDQTNGR